MTISKQGIFQRKYSFYGFLGGISIFIIYLIVELVSRKLPLNLDSLNEIYNRNYIFWYILAIPFIVGIVSYFVSTLFSRKIITIQSHLNEESTRTREIFEFVDKLNNDETDAELSISDTDNELGKAIIQLSEKIRKGEEEEQKRREEDNQRNWIAEGLAKFGEILRHNNDNITELSNNIISNLIKYINANQGGIFFVNDDDPNNMFIEQTASYAYDRKKFADRKLEWGEGIIGTCIHEQDTIYLKNVPDDYLNITSGLGQAMPRNLLIVPLIVNNEAYGAIEIASFHEFKKYIIQFVERVAESIATTISNVKINVRTSNLLEESREQSEAVKSQEEEIRQNLEELQATQEEAKRQSEEFVSFVNSVNHTMIRAEYNTEGILLYANTKFIHKLGYTKNSEVEGEHISMFINIKDRDWFNDIWDGLARGGKHFEGYMKHVTKDGQDLWTMATYTCVRNDDRSVKKILFLALDTTELKKQSLDFKGQLDALNRANIKAELFTSGAVLDCNRKFREVFKYPLVDIYEKQMFDLIHREEKQSFEEQWSKIVKGKPVEGVFRMITSAKEEKWLRGTFSPVYDMYNEISKIIFVGNDITNEKLMEIQTKEQTDMLQAQEEKLKLSEINLSRRLKETREAVRQQYKEVETIKIINEKTLEGILDAVITINEDGIIMFFNKAAEELWGIKKSDLIGRNIDTLFNEEQQKKSEFVKKFVIPGTDKVVGERKEISIINKKGEEIPVLILLSEAHVEDKYVYTAFIQNISVDLF